MKLLDAIFRRAHDLPTEWIMSTLVPSIFTKADWIFRDLNPVTHLPEISSPVVRRGGSWWLCVQLQDGKFIERWHPQKNFIDAVKARYAHDIVRYLNKQSNHGGAWSAAWLFDWKDFYLTWRDKDGDIQIQMDSVGWHEIMKWSLDVWAEHAEQSWLQWLEFGQHMEWNGGELVKAAQGERKIH